MRTEAFKAVLKDHPDRQYRDYVVIGLAEGFRVGFDRRQHVKKLWTSMHNSAYNCDFKNLIAPLNSLGTLEIYHGIKTAN